MSFRGAVGDIEETGRNVGAFSFQWRIPSFLSLPLHDRGDYYESPLIASDKVGLWGFRVYPAGMQRCSRSRWLHLFVFKLDYGPPAAYNITVGIRGAKGVQNRMKRIAVLSEDDPVDWNRFCEISELRRQRARLMPDNVLTISLDVEWDEPRVSRGVSTCEDAPVQTDGEFRDPTGLTGENQMLDKGGGEKVLEDFGKLLSSGEDSDVTVQVGDTVFKVHKLILSARCPVLSAMFRHETKESATNSVKVNDCEPDVFRDFLQYLYTGSVRSLTEQNSYGLYRIADKYLADDLKLQCLKYIRDTISVETFCNTLKLSLTHGESDLMQQAIGFATENIRSIVCSGEWQNFIREYPTEANEIFIKSLGPPCDSQKPK